MLKVKIFLTIYFDKEHLEYMCDRLGDASAVVSRYTDSAFKATLIVDHIITSGGYYEIHYTDIEKGWSKIIIDPDYIQEAFISTEVIS